MKEKTTFLFNKNIINYAAIRIILFNLLNLAYVTTENKLQNQFTYTKYSNHKTYNNF